MKKIILPFLVLFGITRIMGQGITLSPAAEFSLITIKPGNELYSGFGHSAFVVFDSTNKLARSYNYGVFDFNDPNFYLNFTRGKLKYMCAATHPMDLLGGAQYENRSVVQQKLNLSAAQKQKLYDFLEWNIKPENRYYMYDFFYDNCSSRLRDVLAKVCGDSLRYAAPADTGKSFRQLINPYLRNKQIQDLGMDFGMGTPADVIATPAQQMFLPDYLQEVYGKSQIYRNGKWEKLVTYEGFVLEAKPENDELLWYQQPLTYAWLAFGLITLFSIFQLKTGNYNFAIDYLFFSIVALFGTVLIFLWFFTDHRTTPWNMNLWWSNPILFVGIYWLIKKEKYATRLVKGTLIYFFILLCILLYWSYWDQELNPMQMPIMLILLARSIVIYSKAFELKTKNGNQSL